MFYSNYVPRIYLNTYVFYTLLKLTAICFDPWKRLLEGAVSNFKLQKSWLSFVIDVNIHVADYYYREGKSPKSLCYSH